MTHIESRSKDELPELATVLNNAEATMGFIPNSMLTMAHMPQLTMAFSMHAGTVLGSDLATLMRNYADQVPANQTEHGSAGLRPDQIQLVAYAVSLTAGCRYCQAHTSHNAHRFGISEAKLQAVLDYEQSDLFDEVERALIAIGLAGGQVPNATDANHFAALQAHFVEAQIVQIVAVISLFGFLNRWNDTMATQLEQIPTDFAQSTLAPTGWSAQKHG